MNSAEKTALALLYAPTSTELCRALPPIGQGLQTSLELVAERPSLAAVNQAAAQVAGAQAYLQRLREALSREGAAS